jgi:hypothetical protein
VSQFISNRFSGVFRAAYSRAAYSQSYPTYTGSPEIHSQIYNGSPGHFLATPALWGGLLFAALALILIIRLRRSSGPI